MIRYERLVFLHKSMISVEFLADQNLRTGPITQSWTIFKAGIGATEGSANIQLSGLTFSLWSAASEREHIFRRMVKS